LLANIIPPFTGLILSAGAADQLKKRLCSHKKTCHGIGYNAGRGPL
jgi:hypothetical protein